jgi:septal ring factor EnvC (AmiA/AmiB activator)
MNVDNLSFNKILNYCTLVLLIGAGCWYYFDRKNQDADFKQRLDQIEQTRLNLEDSIAKLKILTSQKDSVLQNAILKNNEIIDHLNGSLKKINTSSKVIDNQMKKNSDSIDKLWNEN